MVQHIDGIQPEFELPTLIDLDALNHVHVEAKAAGSFDRGECERPNLSRLRIHQNDLTVWSHDRFIAVCRVQAVQRCDVGQTRVRDLRESVEVDDAIGDFRHFSRVFRQ